MKIIERDIFDRETKNEYIICKNINAHYGKAIVEFLNSKESFGEFYHVLQQSVYCETFDLS